MNFTRLHRISASIVFAIAFVVFLATVAPTLSFWDCGEFITATITMGIPHPPGAPFFQLVGRMLSFLPIGDLGFRVNLISTISSALTVLFVYLTAMRLLRIWHGEPKNAVQELVMILSSAAGALTLAFSDTFWFNASEAEVYGIGMFFISLVVWAALEWYAHAGVFDSERTLLFIAYLMGLSIGVHLLALLALFFVFPLLYLRDREPERITTKTFLLFCLVALAGFAVVYPGIVKFIPKMLADPVGKFVVVLLLAGLVAVVASKTIHAQVRMGVLAALLIILGYSTYTLVVIRANQNPAMNENAPRDLETLYSYLNREQYGDYPLLRGFSYNNRTQEIDQTRLKWFPRRWNPEENVVKNYKNYSSDWDYFIRYQLYEMYIRYFLWNFVGRAGDTQGAPPVIASAEGDWSESPGYPNRYFAIPLLLGLIGVFSHFQKDRKTWFAFMILFLIMGVGLVVYFNMADPQPRERDYFFVGSFYVFALWVGIGVYGLWELLRERLRFMETATAGIGLAVLALLVCPGNMLKQNFRTHNRHENYVAFDYAYNLLQSCDKDAILFTGGDNDTFPVWYMQYVAGVRRDVRVVNLSLVNTAWYMKQLKNERPYGAKVVNIPFSDPELDRLQFSGEAWDRKTISIPIDRATYDTSWMRGVPTLAGREVPATMEWEIASVRKDRYGTPMLIAVEIMIREIVRNHINDRPIYFALSTAPGDRLGLDNFLVVEGLAARVTPFRQTTQSFRYYPPMNIEATEKHLMRTRTVPDSNRAFGFMFRELDNPKINLDEASTRMVYSYRLLYMELAKSLEQDIHDGKRAREVMDRMERVMPEEYHEFGNEMRMQRALTYFVIKDNERARRETFAVERMMMPDVDRLIRGESQDPTAFSILLQLYEQTGQNDRALALLEKYQRHNPGDPSVEAEIRNLKARMGVQPKDS
ncbi:MAG: DUF2723 domain-containing protein [Bacteroidota bacterium]|nr:DUF2723 domain-containing protein [Bacteroidota bacterium]